MRYIFGKWEEHTPLTAADVVRIMGEAEKYRKACASYPTDKIMRIFSRLRTLWQNPEFELRRKLQRDLPAHSGFSPEMIKLAFDELGVLFDPALLERKLLTEFRKVPKKGSWSYNPLTGTAFSWYPLGTLLHILSGNVFLVGAGSLVAGLITGNVNILKMSSQETLFLPCLVESLIGCDEEGILSKSFAVLEFPSSAGEVIAEFKKQVDGIVVWGGEEAVKAYRADLPAKTRLIVFGPKMSLAIVTREGLRTRGIMEAAEKLAMEISIWDQNACTAPQVCYVEGWDEARRLAEALSGTLKEISRSLPQGEIEFDAAAEIRKLRTVAEVAEARGEGALCESPGDLAWTVIVEKNMDFEPSPLYRTIRVIPYERFPDVISQIEPLRGYIQTVGLVSGDEERSALCDSLAEAGALRLVEPGLMAGGEVDDPHDGCYDLPHFMNIVFTRSASTPAEYEPVDFAPEGARRRLIDERLRLLIDRARRSAFYSRRLAGISIETVEDLAKIPVLTRAELDANSPPRATSLCTGPLEGGYVSRSGGSTGEPTFAIYDDHDWEEMIQNAVRLFRAAGIARGDRLANCFIAGNLYGSFVSFDHINCRVGVTSFALGNEVTPEVFVDTWKKFALNVVMGVPSTIVPLLRKVKKCDSSFTMPRILYAGSPLSRIDYDWMKHELDARSIASIIGANDGGQIAFQCSQMQGSAHHTVDDYNYIEIVDEKGTPVPPGVPGKILITSLLKYHIPLIRYEIGDEGRMLPRRCPCGRTIRVMEYLGRADDVLVMGLLNVRHRDFQEALSALAVSEIQLVGRNSEQGDCLLVRVESDKSAKTLKKKVHETILRDVAMISERVHTGAIASLEVEICRPGSLPRNPQSDKIKRIIDERN